MDYFEGTARALDWIEDHLEGDIELADVASEAGASLFWFHRVFAAMTGESLGSYIRKRRLTRAARELVESSRRILDIALDHGFGSQEAFHRAFKEHFGQTPARFRKAGLLYTLRGRKDLDWLLRNHAMRSAHMQARIETHPTFTVVGPQLATTGEGGQNHKAIPLFWQRWMESKQRDLIPHLSEPWREYGLCADMAPGSNQFIYMIGEAVDHLSTIPPGMVARSIPEARYAVFTAKGPMPETIQQVWGYAYGTWLPASTEWERADSEDFELYDQRCMGEVPEVEIWIPVRPRSDKPKA